MNRELQNALVTDEESLIREHLLVVQTLCNLVLEQEKQEELTTKLSPSLSSFPQDKQNKSIHIDEKKSDSLFDF